MATRPRRPATTATKESLAPATAESSQESSQKHDEIPDVRLIGSLHPLPSREERIAIAAYWRAAKRQFEPGHELDDWLDAEREIEGQPGNDQAGNDQAGNDQSGKDQGIQSR